MKNSQQKYRLLALDLDETLLDPKSVLSEYAVSVLRAIAEKGVKVIISTGRSYLGSHFYLKQIGLNNPGIFCNGAQIRGSLDGNILEEYLLPMEEARLAIRLGEETGGHPRVYMNDMIYVSHLTEEDKIFFARVRVPFEVIDDLYAFLNTSPTKLVNAMSDLELVPLLVEKNKRAFQDRIYVTQSISVNSSTLIEYMNVSATKGKAVKKLAAMWGISRDEIVVAGDNFNDLPMFAEAGLSIAPQNAPSAILDAASVVCRSNAEDGVPKKLAEIFLQRI